MQIRSADDDQTLVLGFLIQRRGEALLRGIAWPTHGLVLLKGVGIDLFARAGGTFLWLQLSLRDPLVPAALREAALQLESPVEIVPWDEEFSAVREAALWLMTEPQESTRPARFWNAATQGRLVNAFLRAARLAQTTLERRAALRRYDFVRRAEAFMSEHFSEPLSLKTISEAMGCSPRTLTYNFKSVVGMSPIAYFKVLRLNLVREEIRSERGAVRSIFDIAADYGFWHMGHFGANFKMLFGVSPSEARAVARTG